MVKLFHHVLFSRVLERVNDQEMRDGKSVDTIRDSCYHKEKGAEKTWEGWGAAHTSNVRKITNFKLYTTWAHILSDRNKFAPRGEGENGGVQCPRGFSCFSLFSFFFSVTCPRLLVFARPDKYPPCLSLHGLGIVS